jgi:hypothetical protein
VAHLSPEELLDIAEGALAPPAHVDSCDECRRQVDAARAMMASLADAGVPEPSPLFWHHLSARVSEAIADQPAPRPSPAWRYALSAAGLAAAAALVFLVWGTRPPSSARAPVSSEARVVEQTSAQAAASNAQSAGATAQSPMADAAAGVSVAGDASLAFVVDLASDMNIDPSEAAGLAPGAAADHAVAHMTESELRALADLLKDQMPNGRPS